MSFPGQGYSIGGYQPTQQPFTPQQGGYPPQQGGYPSQQGGYPPQQGGYPPQQGGYPPQQGGYPPQQGSYPPQQGGYPLQQSGHLPQQGGYPPQQGGYPPQQGVHSSQQAGYPPQQVGYPPQQSGYRPQDIQSNRPLDRNIPPAYSPHVQDPMFLPSDPNLSQANYPQPPYSIHNQSPNPVPYGQPQSNTNDYIMHVNPKYRNIPPPNFQLSNCQGRKRALLIGINYFGTSAELKGCINDVENIKRFLVSMYNFNEQDMVILTDNQSNPQNIPTKQNIIRAMQWLVHDSRPNDSFFFHFSGHGGRMRDYDGDEDDGYDETIYPVDHATYGQIVDDMMNDIMVRNLVPGCRLTAIFDSCHSGTALDLPYIYSTKGAIKQQSFLKDAGSSLKNAGKAYISGDPSRAISSVMSLGSRILSGNKTMKKEKINQIKGSGADVIMFSGCKDDQTSADATEAGRATGAMSYAITKALMENRNQAYIQLLNSIRTILKEKYNQRPQLSSSHPMDMNLLFVL